MKRYAGAAVVLVIGLSQMTGQILDCRPLAGVGLASGAAPAPKVFSSVRGLETFSTRFTIEWTDETGRVHQVPLTPERVSRLRGPYNRRNVYGATLAYGPVLASDPATRPMFLAVAKAGLAGDRPLLRELGIDADAVRGPVRLRLQRAEKPWRRHAEPLVIEIGDG